MGNQHNKSSGMSNRFAYLELDEDIAPETVAVKEEKVTAVMDDSILPELNRMIDEGRVDTLEVLVIASMITPEALVAEEKVADVVDQQPAQNDEFDFSGEDFVPTIHIQSEVEPLHSVVLSSETRDPEEVEAPPTRIYPTISPEELDIVYTATRRPNQKKVAEVGKGMNILSRTLGTAQAPSSAMEAMMSRSILTADEKRLLVKTSVVSRKVSTKRWKVKLWIDRHMRITSPYIMDSNPLSGNGKPKYAPAIVYRRTRGLYVRCEYRIMNRLANVGPEGEAVTIRLGTGQPIRRLYVDATGTLIYYTEKIPGTVEVHPIKYLVDKYGRLHSPDGKTPAYTDEKGIEYYYYHGRFGFPESHNVPTVVYTKATGSTIKYEYIVNGKYHRLKGPAKISADTKLAYYYRHGKLHRSNGPALITPKFEECYLDGRPAVVCGMMSKITDDKGKVFTYK